MHHHLARLIREPVTIISTLLYLALFIYIYIQLILVLIYGHKRWCYRTLLLYTSISWAGLRVTLFTYYCTLEHHPSRDVIPELSRHVETFGYFLLFSLPVYLQFCVLSLLVSYFSQLVRSSEDRYLPRHGSIFNRLMSCRTWLIALPNGIVFFTNLICAILIKSQEDLMPALSEHSESDDKPLISQLPNFVVYVIYGRVLINGVMFISLAVALTYLIVRVAQTTEVRLLLETEDMTQTGARSVGLVLVTLYMCRTAANILALIPSIGWIYDTDQIDLLSDSKYGYFTFLVAVFVWEYLPTLASVVFFRVKKPSLLCYPPIVETLTRSTGLHSTNSDEEPIFSPNYLPQASFQTASDTWYGGLGVSDSNSSSIGNSVDSSMHSPAYRFLNRYGGADRRNAEAC